MSTSAPYDIIRTQQDTCAQSGRAIEVGEEHIAALIETPEEEALVRVAYSLEAWGNGPNLPPGASLFGFWKRTRPEKDEPPRQLVSPDEMMDLFEQLGDADDTKQITFRYLLALMLMRKKALLFEGATSARDGEHATLLLRQRVKGGGGQLFEVIDPGLDDQTIADAAEQIGQVMNLDANEEGVL